MASKFRDIVRNKLELKDFHFEYRCSNASRNIMQQYEIHPIDVKMGWPEIVDKYFLVISVHCKQIFPKEMIERVRCINIHPGYNPHNRGWFPQVFSILNKLPLGATIHEIDEQLDHGKIIMQRLVPVFSYDTSLTAYNRVQIAEIEMLEESIIDLVFGRYETYLPIHEGNVNLKKDFNNMLEINMDENLTMRQAIDKLRALTHGAYKNAYFYSEKGDKIFVSIDLQVGNEKQ
jgi:methionyl-tRNA formyltransferase